MRRRSWKSALTNDKATRLVIKPIIMPEEITPEHRMNQKADTVPALRPQASVGPITRYHQKVGGYTNSILSLS